MSEDVRVLVVEDEEIAAAAHAEYMRRIDGFTLAGVARTGAEAITILGGSRAPEAPAIDLVLLDMNLPDLHGLDVCRRIHAAALPTEVIAITAVRELSVVRNAISSGIVQYIIKPFTFSTLAEKLGNYRQFRDSLAHQADTTTQTEVDQAFAALRDPGRASLPKGMSEQTLSSIIDLLRRRTDPASASEVTETVGVSRVTARRYLEFLAEQGSVRRTPRYGTPGRPENEYSWARPRA